MCSACRRLFSIRLSLVAVVAACEEHDVLVADADLERAVLLIVIVAQDPVDRFLVAYGIGEGDLRSQHLRKREADLIRHALLNVVAALIENRTVFQ